MPDESSNNPPVDVTLAHENKDEDIHKSDSISQDELEKQLKDKELGGMGEFIKANKIALLYIDQRSGGNFFNKEATISGDIIGRDQHKWQTHNKKGDILNKALGQILISDLSKITSVYISPSGYDTATQILNNHHILILWGRAHFGKWSTALHILHSFHNANIYELDPGIALETLSFEDSPKCGYVIDTFLPDSVDKLNAKNLGRLGEQLRKHNAHLIITIDERTLLKQETLENYLIIWQKLPNLELVIEKHLAWYSPDTTIYKKATEFSQHQETVELLNQSTYLPGDIDRITKLLVEAASENYTLSEALEQLSTRVIQKVERWYEENDALDDRILLLSVAVYNGASYQTIHDAEKRLRALFPSEENKPIATNFFGTTRNQRLRRIEARLKKGFEDTEFGSNSVEIVEFDNPNSQRIILQYTWNEYNALREILIRWLGDSVLDAPFETRFRAAAAIGELSKYDFGYIQRELLNSLSNHPNSKVRTAAAFALGISAWESEKAPLVLKLLHHWSTMDNFRLCWTAASAYGGLVGLRFPDAALRNLYIIAQKGDHRLLGIISQSINNLFNAGENAPSYWLKIIEALVEWAHKPKEIGGITSVFIFLQIASINRTKANLDSETSPTLLWLMTPKSIFTAHLVTLWRKAFNLKATRTIAFIVLKDWVKEVEQDMRLFDSLYELIHQLVQQGQEREKDRLKHHLYRWENIPEIAKTVSSIIDRCFI